MGNWFFTVALAIGVVLILVVYLLLHRYGEYILVFLAYTLAGLFVAFIAIILTPGEFFKFVKKTWAKMKRRYGDSKIVWAILTPFVYALAFFWFFAIAITDTIERKIHTKEVKQI